MKKIKDFAVLPLTQVLVGVIGLIMSFTGSLSWFIIIPISLVIYILAGKLFSKIESQKTKVISAIAAFLLVAAACIAILISAEYSNRDDFYMLLFISPFALPATFLANLITDSQILTYSIVTLLCSACPVLITALAAKVFKQNRIKDI
ncbi:MAG: hypothetical protein K2H13_07330 [Eubacterium sp.]|nr:hypothetical protein [Eubacterium sp.]MDE6155455.1 hypothetical protein [Eubacterium sp.]MDE6767886.1 hypothetical protein [Eubacterium sp.]